MTPNKYGIRVLWSEEDGAFIATCPDFEGLSAFGDSKAEALEEMETVLRMEIEAYEAEGRALPAPQLLHQYSGQFRLRLPSSLHARLAEQAEAEGVSLNTLLTSYLAERSGQALVLTQARTLFEEWMKAAPRRPGVRREPAA